MSLGLDCRDPLWVSEWEGDEVFPLHPASAHVGPFTLFVQVEGWGCFFWWEVLFSMSRVKASKLQNKTPLALV